MDDMSTKVLVAVIFGLLVAAAFVAVWVLDRRRAQDVAEETDRLDQSADTSGGTRP